MGFFVDLDKLLERSGRRLALISGFAAGSLNTLGETAIEDRKEGIQEGKYLV